MRWRKKQKEPQEQSNSWMDTYGDMVTLLLTFFVLLFSFSTIDAQKWEEIVSSLSGTPFVAVRAIDPGDVKGEILTELNYEPTPTPQPTLDTAAANILEIKKRFDELYEKIKEHIRENDLGNLLNVEHRDNAVLIRMSDSALFDSGKVELKVEARMILGSICGIVEEYEELIRSIRVEGHTDNVPIHTANFRDNWELSTARALEVVWFMLSIMEIEPSKMIPTGYGEYHPVETNDTPVGRACNRRVDFVIESILIE